MAGRISPERAAESLRDAINACRGCELYRRATQGVPGEGPARARLMLVGEQPGNDEDLAGRPFVGPAGQLLDRALAEAGIARTQPPLGSLHLVTIYREVLDGTHGRQRER